MDKAERNKLEWEVAHGNDAKHLFGRVRPYFDAMRASILDAFEHAPLNDIEGLQLLRLQLNALEKLEINMSTEIQTGQLAAESLKQVQND